jgi:hypothetical protein
MCKKEERKVFYIEIGDSEPTKEQLEEIAKRFMEADIEDPEIEA